MVAVEGERTGSTTFSRTAGSAWRFRAVLLALGVALAASVTVAASVGAVAVPLQSVAGILLHRAGMWPRALTWSATDATIVLDVRLPRVITATLIGAALSAAGVLFQALLRNPLADPVHRLARLAAPHSARRSASWCPRVLVPAGQACQRWHLRGRSARPPGLFARSCRWEDSIVTLLLAGLSVSVILGYSMSLLLLMSGRFQRDLGILYGWLLGGVTTAPWSRMSVIAAIVLVGCAGATGARGVSTHWRSGMRPLVARVARRT